MFRVARRPVLLSGSGMRTCWMAGTGMEFVFYTNGSIMHASEAESESTRAKNGQESFATSFMFLFFFQTQTSK